MGSVEFMRLVRQRTVPLGKADQAEGLQKNVQLPKVKKMNKIWRWNQRTPWATEIGPSKTC